MEKVSLGRRLFSHLLIWLAVFCLTATFFIWVIDAAVLSPAKLVPALRSANVPAAVANAIPDMATKQNDSGKPASPAEIADMKAKIASVITPAYVDKKLQNIVDATTTFLKQGTPEPTLDLSDFPAQLRASGALKPGDGADIDKNFATPIELNKNGKLNKLPTAYKMFKMLKYAGVLLFLVLLTTEWFVAERGKKLQRAGRIFLHAGLWYGLFFVLLIMVPANFLPKIKDKVNQGASVSILIDDFAKGIQTLFGQYFLGFAITCLAIAAALYVARHGHKHVGHIKAVPDAPKLATPDKKVVATKK